MTTKTKTRAAKTAPKAAPKARAKKAQAGAYLAILSAALAGEFGPAIQRFYTNATKYHARQQTVFPRARNADEPLMSPDDLREFLAARAKTGIPAGSKAAQRAYDQMRVELAAKAG